MNRPKTPGAGRRFRLLVISLGIILFVWLSFEGQNVTWVILFANAICLLGAAAILARSSRLTHYKSWLVYPLAGLLSGAATTPIALLLMAIKTGIHGHSAPDYTSTQILAVLISFPVWVGAGAVIGLGAGLWLKNR
jgi:hypothetical protein